MKLPALDLGNMKTMLGRKDVSTVGINMPEPGSGSNSCSDDAVFDKPISAGSSWGFL